MLNERGAVARRGNRKGDKDFHFTVNDIDDLVATLVALMDIEPWRLLRGYRTLRAADAMTYLLRDNFTSIWDLRRKATITREEGQS